MQLRDQEQIINQFRRHKTPFVFSIIKLLLLFTILYVIAYFLTPYVSVLVSFIIFLAISLVFGFFITYEAFIYFLDKLVITNFRILFVNWKSLIQKEEYEAELMDIQDIVTRSKGFLAKFKIFDYGTIEVQTASSKATIIFDKAPHPESIKNFILAYLGKSSKAV